MRWDEISPETVAKAKTFAESMRLYARYCQQTVGTPMPMNQMWGPLGRRIKAFMIEYPQADWYTLCRVAQWCRTHKVRPRTTVGLVGCFRSAWADGHLPELDPQHVNLEVERRIERALEEEEDETWRSRLLLARGVEARRKLIEEWESKRSAPAVKAATSGRRASSASSSASSSTTSVSPSNANATTRSNGVIVLDLGLPPTPPLSINKANTMHWASKARQLDPWKQATIVLAKQAKIPEKVAERPARVRLVLPFRTKHRRDPHNYVGTVVKATVDGLVLAGVWPDDNPKYVEVMEPRLVIGRNAEVEIEVK